jgi:hypothetical protein
MIRTFGLTSFLMVSLVASLASADPEGGWIEAEASAEGEATLETEEAAEAPAEAAPPTKAKPAEPKATPKAETTKTSADPKKDQTPNPEKDKHPSARRHDGFYLRLSMGGGSVAAQGDRYDRYENRSDYEFEGDAFSADIMVGGTPAPGIAIGGAYLVNSAVAKNDFGDEGSRSDAAFAYGMVGPFIDIFPNPKSGFHVGGALGPAVSVSYDDDENQQSVAAGFGGAAWIGYDFWIADQWSLGAMLRVQGARVETPRSREMEKDSPHHDRLGIGSGSLLLTALYH